MSDLSSLVAETKQAFGATSVQWDGLAELVGQPAHDRIVGNTPAAASAFGCDCSTDAGWEEAKKRAALMASRMGF